ncbi:hypothetical protein [Kordia sp.]|uniref:hypothetical protein n=1 Tax=Kordia sp. TaxID=1965332 RepID=UPI003D28DF91
MIGVGVGLATMNATLKANSRRKRRVAFDKNLHYYKDEGIKNTFPKATKAQLEAVRKKIKQQNRIEIRKSIAAFILGIPVSIFVVKLFFDFMLFLNS